MPRDRIKERIDEYSATLPIFCKQPDRHGIPVEKRADPNGGGISLYCHRCLWGWMLPTEEKPDVTSTQQTTTIEEGNSG